MNRLLLIITSTLLSCQLPAQNIHIPTPQWSARDGWGPTPAFLNIYVEDIEAAYRKALELGAVSVTDITELWFGEKVRRILDPFGDLLWINQRVEEVDFTDQEQVGKRATTPEAVEGIAYIQKSLDEALKEQKRFFQGKYQEQ